MSAAIISHLRAADPILAQLLDAVGPCELQVGAPCHPFQSLAEAITHQQLNGTAAKTILGRFVQCCAEDGAFPTPQRVLAAPEATLRAAGLSFAKIAALKDLAGKTLAGVVPDRATLVALEDHEIISRLTQVRGIGRWTVEMLLMFQLGRADILPVDDFGVRAGFRFTYGLRKMPAPKVLAAYGERWSPYRSAVTWYLWRAVELQRAGKLPAPIERVRLPRVKSTRRGSRRARGVASLRDAPRQEGAPGAYRGATHASRGRPGRGAPGPERSRQTARNVLAAVPKRGNATGPATAQRKSRPAKKAKSARVRR